MENVRPFFGVPHSGLGLFSLWRPGCTDAHLPKLRRRGLETDPLPPLAGLGGRVEKVRSAVGGEVAR